MELHLDGRAGAALLGLLAPGTQASQEGGLMQTSFGWLITDPPRRRRRARAIDTAATVRPLPAGRTSDLEARRELLSDALTECLYDELCRSATTLRSRGGAAISEVDGE